MHKSQFTVPFRFFRRKNPLTEIPGEDLFRSIFINIAVGAGDLIVIGTEIPTRIKRNLSPLFGRAIELNVC